MSPFMKAGTLMGEEEEEGEEDGEPSRLGGLKGRCFTSVVASSFHREPLSELLDDGRRRWGEGDDEEEL